MVKIVNILSEDFRIYVSNFALCRNTEIKNIHFEDVYTHYERYLEYQKDREQRIKDHENLEY